MDIVKIKSNPKHTTVNTLRWVNGSITGKQLSGRAAVVARVSYKQRISDM